MKYQVWTQGYGDMWARSDCESENEVKMCVMGAIKAGETYEVTQVIDVDVQIVFQPAAPAGPEDLLGGKKSAKEKYKEGVSGETNKSRPEENKSSGAESNSSV